MELTEYRSGKIFTKKIMPKHDGINIIQADDDCEFFEYYDDGKVKLHYFMSDGVLDGEYNSFYEDGKNHVKCYFKNGKFVDKFEEYYKNNQMKLTIDFISHEKNIKIEKDGLYTSLQIQINTGLTLSGIIDGNSVEFYENGNPKSYYQTKNCRAEGQWIDYYENEKIRLQRNFKNGLMNGEYNEFYENGVIKQTYMMEDGKIDGEFIFYYENKHIKTQGSYKKGVNEGKWTYWYDNDKLFAIGYYRNNKAFGEWIFYDCEEQIKFKGICFDDNFYGYEYMDVIPIRLLLDEMTYDKLVNIYKINEVSENNSNRPYELIKFIEEETDYEIEDDDNACLICSGNRNDVIDLGCNGENKHSYHLNCIIKWFMTQESKDKQCCPCCTKEINWKLCKKIKIKPKDNITVESSNVEEPI